MSKTGLDSASCGRLSQPCKTVTQAIQRVAWRGHIYLDGTGSERQPYECHPVNIYGRQHPGIKVEKSLSMEGIKSTPHISCFGGLQFQSINREISVVLSGIVFRQTPLLFQDCSLVKVLNSSFRDATTALTVHIKNITGTHLDIKGSSLFENNTSCIDVLTSNNQTQFLTVNVNDTTFQKNGRFGSRLTKGAITIKSDKRKSSSIAQVQISCFKIIYTNNYGYFVNLDLPAATTREVFSDVTLVDNTVSGMMRPSGRNTYSVVKSLYTSRARKTFVEFANLRCFSNQYLRCLRIRSDESAVKVHNSSFVGQKIPTERGAGISLESKTHASLILVNSKFRRNKAKAGGALFAHSKDGTIELTIIRVNFTECFAVIYGCAILVGDPKTVLFTNQTGTHKLIANLTEVRVQNCFGEPVKRYYRRKCIIFHFLLTNGNVTISGSRWANNTNSIKAALMVGNTGGKTDITISGCTFVRNAAVDGGVVKFPAISEQAGSVTVENTAMSNEQIKTNALFISPKFRIKLTNVSFDASYGIALAVFKLPRMHQTISVNIYICNCAFLNNAQDIVIQLLDASKIKFIIENTIFTTKRLNHKDFGIYFNVNPLRMVNSSNAVIKLDNVTFNSRPSNIFKLNFPGKKSLKIQRSIFRGGICFHQYVPKDNLYEVGTGAISVLSFPDKLNKSGCVEKHKNENIHPLWSYDTAVIFEDTTFEGNAGLIAGAVYISNGNVTFNRCTFRDNFATKRSGHVYSAFGTGRVHFKDCSFSKSMKNLTVNGTIFEKSTLVYSESGGPVKFENTSMVSTIGQRTPFVIIDISNGGYVDMDNRSNIECSTGSKLFFENNTHFVHVYNEINGSSCRINVTVLKYSCSLCPPGYYSLRRGVSNGLNVQSSFECLPCPFGATCVERNIAAKPNFWGYPFSKDSPSLNFYACPEHYCQSPTSDSNEYNSCYGNRTGFLCGKCALKYSETLFSTECRQRTECNNYLIWIITILFTTTMAFYLLTKPPVLSFLARQIVWFIKREDYHSIEEVGQVDTHSDNGYLKITFYFYQAAELLIVGSKEEMLHHKIPFVSTVVDAFNFQVRTLHRVIDCPFAGLTAVTKELLLSGSVFLTMTELVAIYCLHIAINKIRRKERPCATHYIAVVIELLLLGYERLAETSLKLMHCVSIGSEKRLFIDAELVCWQWWQYILLIYIIASVVPFIAVLYYGSHKLYKASISAKEFLGACIFPLPFLVYWLLNKMLNRRKNTYENRQSNKDVLEVLHGPFRKPNDHNKGTLHWESVLIGRRFILLSCLAFITNSMFRMVCMAAVCVVILLHHVFKNPYRDPIANKVETSSLLTLVMIAMINLTKATLISFGTSVVGPSKPYLEALEWFEVCALAFVPTLLSIFVTSAIFSQFVRLIVSLKKLIFRCVRWRPLTLQSTTELERPILYISEER